MSRATVGRIRACEEGTEARRERFSWLKRRRNFGRLIGEQRTPSLGTRRIRHQRKANRFVGQCSLNGSAQCGRSKRVLLAGLAIRRCELGDACQLKRCKTVGRRYGIEVIYERRDLSQKRFVCWCGDRKDVQHTKDALRRDGRLCGDMRVYVRSTPTACLEKI